MILAVVTTWILCTIFSWIFITSKEPIFLPRKLFFAGAFGFGFVTILYITCSLIRSSFKIPNSIRKLKQLYNMEKDIKELKRSSKCQEK